MRVIRGFFLLLLLGTVLPATRGADWPTYRGDYSRSGISPETLPLPLENRWTFQSTHPPQPAWGGEAKWDGYNKVYDLKHRQDFDKAFHVVTSQDRVYFGSSADDKVYCLDARTGAGLWAVYTEGPVRLAPTCLGERLYVGSDDGFVYCLSQTDGALIWKTRLGPRDYRIPGNGRVISAWPVRTSVVATPENVYACAGLFPSEGVYLCALNPADGALRWKQTITDLPAQGYLLASATRLYVPTGRNNPIVFDRSDGSRLRTVAGAGGTYALLAGDTLVFGPGKTGQLGVVESGQTDQIATFAGNHLIVTPGRSYLHSDTELSALNRQRYIRLVVNQRQLEARKKEADKRLKALKAASPDATRLRNELSEIGEQLNEIAREKADCVPWKRPCRQSYSLILAGQALIAGGDNEVAAYATEEGTPVWKAPVKGKVYGLAAAGGRLYASTDRGSIHCFAEAANPPR